MDEMENLENLPLKLPPKWRSIFRVWRGQFVEFKQSLPDLAKEIVGFANAEGGRIYIGVTDTNEIIGYSANNRSLAEILDTARKLRSVDCGQTLSV